MSEKAVINKSNKIVNALSEKRVSSLIIGYNSIIGVRHFIDMTHDVIIGENSILAGLGGQLRTHSFYHDKQGSGRVRKEGAIEIGNNIYQFPMYNLFWCKSCRYNLHWCRCCGFQVFT